MIRRNTNQSQIVYKSIEFMGHTTSEKLIEYINSNYENISLATIYRNLSKLLEEGQIRKLRLGNDEIYETVKENHYHLFHGRVARRCGISERLDLQEDDADSLKYGRRREFDDGFVLHELSLCEGCIQAGILHVLRFHH